MRNEGRTHTDSSKSCPYYPAHFRTNEGGNIDGKRPWGRFGNRDEIDELFEFHPSIAYNIRLDQGDHSISAADGKKPNLKKGEKKLKKNHLTCPLPFLTGVFFTLIT